jgi:peptidoglycan hydrolase-like protein with peptidoglycan-binding domain
MLSTMLGKMFVLALLFGGREGEGGGGGPYAPSMPVPSPGDMQRPAPWPQAVPTDLPPFPVGWEYDVPPPPSVVARAQQLLSQLWSTGQGSIVQENTEGRWITYRAEVVAGGIKGVTAWRLKSGAAASSAPASSAPMARAPAPAPSTYAPAPNLPPPMPPPYVPATYSTSPATSPISLPRSVPSTATAPFIPVYTPPAGGMSVQQIQTALNGAGAHPPLTPDGKYGPLTRAAVVGFQADHGLTQDGMAGPLTQQALRPFLNASTAPAQAPVFASSAPAAVPATYTPGPIAPTQSTDAPPMSSAQVQSALNAAGAMPPLVVDGKVGPKSVAAIKAFQTTHGLSADGIVGPLTTAKLRPYLDGLT